MGFLIRVTFWFSLVLLALPLDGTGTQNGEHQVNAIEAIIAAGEAMTDIAGMCERKPEVCETGKSAISTIGVRAREVSRIAYESFDQKPDETDSTATGTIPVPSEPVAPEPAPAN
jgi:hypothetical protein